MWTGSYGEIKEKHFVFLNIVSTHLTPFRFFANTGEWVDKWQFNHLQLTKRQGKIQIVIYEGRKTVPVKRRTLWPLYEGH